MKYNFYCITNNINGKKYIGLTKRDVGVRFKEHVRGAMNNHDINNSYIMPLFNSMRKYGVDNFNVELLESCEFSDFTDAEDNEGKLIKKHKTLLNENGYNLNLVENGKRTYVKEIRQKIVDNNVGVNNPFYGKNHTEQTRKNLSEKAKIRFSDPTNNPRYGYRYTEEEKDESRKKHAKFAKPFYGDGKYYNSLSDAARKLNLTKQAILHRLKSKTFEQWFYINQ